jgi:hypothetical protein
MHKQLQSFITVIKQAICAAMFARPVAGQSLAVLSRKEST